MTYVHPDKRTWKVRIETTWGAVHERTVHLPQHISRPLMEELRIRAAKLVGIDPCSATCVLEAWRV